MQINRSTKCCATTNYFYYFDMFISHIQTCFADIFGLVNYLHLHPYSQEDTWKHLLHSPYLKGNTEPMHKFLAEVMWRTAKCEVMDQV